MSHTTGGPSACVIHEDDWSGDATLRWVEGSQTREVVLPGWALVHVAHALLAHPGRLVREVAKLGVASGPPVEMRISPLRPPDDSPERVTVVVGRGWDET